LSRDGDNKVSFLPALIDKQLRSKILRRTDARFDAVRYMEWASEGIGLTFKIDGHEVVVSG
jgi:hypothetical protein